VVVAQKLKLSTAYLYTRSISQLDRSGDVFTLTTDDPNRKPLPSLNLLEMALTAINRNKGAAGENEIDDNTGSGGVVVFSV
jgi:hypothetical protein